MDHSNNNSNLSPEQKLYDDYMNRANDFLKIELYRPALKWLTVAGKLNIETEPTKKKIDDCREKIRKETRTIGIIAAIACLVAIVFIVTL